MGSNDTTAISSVPPSLRQSRSLHDLFSGFFLSNHINRRPSAGLTGPFRDGAEQEGLANNSNALALAVGTQFEGYEQLESAAEVTAPVTSSSLRRSETWNSSLQKSDPLTPDETPSTAAPLPSVQSSSGIISFTASGGSCASGSDASGTGRSIGGLRKSLGDIFGPEKVVVNVRDRSHSLTCSTESPSPLLQSDPEHPTDLQQSEPRLFFPLIHNDVSRGLLRRNSRLSSVSEIETSSEVEPAGSPTHTSPRVEKQLVERRKDSLDVNQNLAHSVIPEGSVVPSTHRKDLTESSSVADENKMATESLTHPEAMKIPEVRPRVLGILQLFASSEKKSVRNKDMNMMAPQSW